MKPANSLKMVFMIMMHLLLASCAEDEILDTTPAQVKFPHATLGISELAGPTDIIIYFGKPATKAGTLTLKVQTDYANDFTTVPSLAEDKIEIPVTAGQSQVKFTITPIHNNLHQGNKNVDFTIKAVPEGLIIGAEKVLTVLIYEADQPNLVNFDTQEGTLIEYTEEGFVASISLSLVALGEGTVDVEITNGGSFYGTYFTTQPAAADGKIKLAVEPGTLNLPIKFIPVDNTTLNGHKEIGLTITSASGAVTKGNQLTFALDLLDDELMNKPKGYETNAYGWRVKRIYEYNEMGDVSEIFWEQNTLSGTDTYHYDETGKLIKISESPTVERRFQYDVHGRIILSEKFDANLLKNYTIYTYDEAGNVGEAAVFNRMPSGEYVMSDLIVYLYYYDSGNLSKVLTYYPVPGKEEFELIQEETYHYLLNYPNNPFPMVDILPGINVQKRYPSNYILSRDGQEYNYAFSYVFNDQGLPVRRTSGNWEVTTYEYY
jgi:hypothetical protein